MNSSSEHRLVLFFFFMLIVIVLSNASRPIQNKGIVQFGNYNENLLGCSGYDESIGCLEVKTQFQGVLDESIVNKSFGDTLNVAKTEDFPKVEDKQKEHIPSSFGDYAKELYLPKDTNKDGISLEKPQIDMRDISMNEWRNDNNTEEKKQDLLLSDLRAYQQQYNEELEENKFKKMTLDEHRQQNIAEWKERVKNQTQNEFKN